MTLTDQERRTGSPGRMAPLRDALVRSMRWEADGVLSLELEPAAGAVWPDWEAGAHLDLELEPGLLRQYSLCSRPGEPWRVAVLREPASRGGSEYVHTRLRPGSAVRLRGPRNNFALEPAGSYRFLAGGIGITPILSMVRRAEALGVPWTLDYLGRSRKSMAFVAEVEALGPRARIHADDADGLFDLSTHLAQPEAGGLAYACGPGGLLAALVGGASSWADPSALHLERFVAAPAEAGPAGAAPGDGAGAGAGAGECEAAFAVELNDGATVDVGPGETILQALEARGYAPLSSCREGICGTCETPVLAGDVDHRDTLLSDAEKEASETMMICVSRARGGCTLRLDL